MSRSSSHSFPQHHRTRTGRRLASALSVVLVAALNVVLLSAPPAAAVPVPIDVGMSASASVVQAGSQLTYTIDGRNNQGERLDDVVLTDQVLGMTGLIITSSVGSCGQSANLVTCDLGSLGGFDTFRVTIRGTVTGPAGETLQNLVTVTATHAANTEIATASTSVLVGAPTGPALPDLAVDIQGPSSIAPNGTSTLTMTVRNQGSAPATDVVAMLTLPLDFSQNGAVTSTNLFFDCVPEGAPLNPATVACDNGRINAGAVATINIPVKAGADDSSSDATAVVDPYDQIEESNELNNTGSLAVTTVEQPPPGPLTLTKVAENLTVAGVGWARPGDLLKYTITATNTATTRIENVDITDGTRGLDAASIVATSTPGVCAVSTFTVRCNLKKPGVRLNPGQTMVVELLGRVVETDGAISYMSGGLITNTATVTGNLKNKGVTATDTATTTVRPSVDLSVVQRAAVLDDGHGVNSPDDPPGFRAWDRYDYVFTVGNSGVDDANDVRTRTVLPEGAQLKSFSAPAGVNCEAELPGNAVRCLGLDLAGEGVQGGTVDQITLTVIAPPAPGLVTAVTTVDPANVLREGDETNNVATTTTRIDTGIDLTVAQRVVGLNPDAVPAINGVVPSGTLVYEITVSNLGTQDATGIVLRDVLPAGTRFRSAVDVSGAANRNFTCAHDGSTLSGNIECFGGRIRGTHDHAEAVDTATITVTLFAPTQPGQVKNQLRVDPGFVIDEIDETNNINTLITPIKIADACCTYHEFTIEKTQKAPVDGGGAPVPVAPSGVLEYDLTVTNHGSDVAFDVAVRDFIPQGATFRFAEDTEDGEPGAFSCTHGNGVIDCIGGTLDGSSNQTPVDDNVRVIHVSVFAPAQPGSYNNQSVVDPDFEIPEANETNNTDTEPITVQIGGGGKYIDLTVDSNQSQPGALADVVPSGELQYTLTVTNSGSAAAFNVVVRDTIPVGSVFRSAADTQPGTSGAFTCSESGGVVTCFGGTLDKAAEGDTPGPAFRDIKINLFAPAQPGDYLNQAMVDPDKNIPEADETNNGDQTPLQVRLGGQPGYIDLQIPEVKSVTFGTDTALPEPQPGEKYSYKVKVKNFGTDVAYDVAVRNAIDPAATYLNATGENGFICSYAGGVVTCDGGTLDGTKLLDPNDEEAVITITVRAPLVHDYGYPTSSRVDPANAIPEANEGNNTNGVNVTVLSQVDLVVESLTTSGSKGNPGEVNLTAKANGTAAAEGFLLTVELPVGHIPQDVVAPAEWTCQIEENPINKVTCQGGLAAGGSAAFKIETFQSGDDKSANAIIDPDNRIVEIDDFNNTKQAS